ncbi:PXA domain-containing protein [Coemansia mojavensis]|nr:PXA domain-containing protein [Coemansia mojavensis]
MYAVAVAAATAARALLRYILVAPLVLGGLVALLLVTNIAMSFWFQRQKQRQHSEFGGKLHSSSRLAVTPPVARIPRLAFASQLPRTVTSSLFPTEHGLNTPSLELERGFPQIAEVLSVILELVVRDFVQTWYGDITADMSFPRCVLTQMMQAIDAIAERVVGKIDAAETIVGQLLPIVTAHIHTAKKNEFAMADATAHDTLPDEQVQGAGKWHSALRDMDHDANEDERKRRVMAHVRRVVNLLVPLVLPPEQASFAPHRLLVRELLTGALLTPMLLSIADPDTINQLLDTQLERLIREQHMVNELRDALNQQAQNSNSMGSSQLAASRDSEDGYGNGKDETDDAEQQQPAVRTYEQFMTTIDECSDLNELQRIIEDILAQIRKRRILIMGQNKDDIVHGQRVKDVLVYINRLYVAKKKAERRLDLLRRDQALSKASGAQQPEHSSPLLAPAAQQVPSGSSLPESLTLPMVPEDSKALPMPGKRAAAGRALSAGSSTLASRSAQPQQRHLTRRGRKSTISRVSTYYQHRDDPAKLGPPQFTMREILTNVSSLSAFAEYMDVIGSKFILEFWVNVEGVRQASKPPELFASIVGSLWKNYFTLRVDELASVGSSSDEVEAAISRVQRLLKPYRKQSSLDLDVERLNERICGEAFELICLVQRAVFRHMEASILPPFLRSAFYTRFLKEYYVTPRQDHLEAVLFEPSIGLPVLSEDASAAAMSSAAIASLPPPVPAGHPVAGQLEAMSDDERARRTVSRALSVTSEQSASLASEPGSVRRRSAGAHRWSFSLRGRSDAPVVKTDTASALATEMSGSRTSISGMAAEPLIAAAMAPDTAMEAVGEQSMPADAPLAARRSSQYVERSEIRRLSASLRSIALENTDATEQALEARQPSPVTELSVSDDSSSEEDEAESLVLARVIKTPTPGDLFLDERLLQLSYDLERKTHQMAIVRALMRQAKSRHRAHEQRVLQASFRGLRREVHAEMEQQRQYQCALPDHNLSPQRTRVHIPRAVTASDPADADDADEPKTHVVYLIELQQSMPEHLRHGSAVHAPTGWVVARRYREFYAMHHELKSLYPYEMRQHNLPARTPLIRLQKDRDIELRRIGLERYLQGLLREPQVCNTRPVRLFLSSTEPPPAANSSASNQSDSGDARDSGNATQPAAGTAGWMEQIYKTVGEDIEGITGADSMLEIIVQELGAQVAMQQTVTSMQQEAQLAPAFVDPLSDLFIQLFGLKNRRNWLRRQAISILLRHIVGGAVERRVRLLVGSVIGDEPLGRLLANLRNTLWPLEESRFASSSGPVGYAKFQGFIKRTDEQRQHSLEQARKKALWYVPRVLGSMVGRKNALNGARLLFDAMQMPAPNLNLVLHIFDALIVVVFPELKFQLDNLQDL